MEYTLTAKYNIGTELYKVNNKGDILSYSITRIDLSFSDNGITNKLDVSYDISDKNGRRIASLRSDEIEESYYIDKKDIIKHLMEQL